MIGLVLVTHGRLATEFRSALEHVVGPQQQIEAITIGPDDDVEQCRKSIVEAVKRVDSGSGVAILTDMFGGTPSNLAISVMSQPKVEVLAGINLPMLIKLAKVRESYGVIAAKVSSKEKPLEYDMHHSSSLHIVDRTGKLRILIPFGTTEADIVHDLKILLAE